MSSLNGRKVISARLHQPIFVPGVAGGQVGPALIKGVGKLNDLEMTKTEDGLYITAQGQEIFIPSAQIQAMVLDKNK